MSGIPVNGIVTPEAVFLQFDPATVGSRIPAKIIDFAIQIVFLFVLAGITYAVQDAGGVTWIAGVVAIVGTFAVLYLYPALFETLWDGRTPGKAALGLRVVTVEGAPVSLRHGMIRSALALVEITATQGLVAFIMCLCTSRHQRLGDLIAGTMVLRERKAATAPQATAFVPLPGSEEYTLSLDVSAITTDDYTTIRSLLLRAHTLQPQARLGLSNQLGMQMAAKIRTTPPWGMPSEVFLVCVAAAYQRRYSY